MKANIQEKSPAIVYRRANLTDIPDLLVLEDQCFETDKLSRRQFRHWITAKNGIMLLAQDGGIISDSLDGSDGKSQPQNKILGYGLVIMRKGTSLARLYSLAVAPKCRGRGVAKALIARLERESVAQQKLFLRLEVSTQNTQAISLYSALGYIKFGYYCDYYEDHNDALRMQKAIFQQVIIKRLSAYPYYQQTTAFTCGSAALMMAMAKLSNMQNKKNGNKSLENNVREGTDLNLLSQSEELAIWRQATTIFMTSGHGGSHPLGLAVAAISRGFKAKVFINQAVPLFLAGVRDENKKQILQKVEQDFLVQATQAKACIEYTDFTPSHIKQALALGQTVLCLISSYQFDGYKGPHWVTITHIDEHFLYLHDPEPMDIARAGDIESVVGQTPSARLTEYNTTENQLSSAADRQHIPVSLENFNRYTCYGKAKLRTAIVLDTQ